MKKDLTSFFKSPVRLALFFLKYEKKKVIILCCFSVLFGLFPIIDSILLKKVVDTIAEFTTNNNHATLPKLMIWWAIGYALWWETWNISWRCYDYIYLKTLPKIQGHIIDQLYDYLQHQSYSFFQQQFVGKLASCITEPSRSIEVIISIITDKIIRKLIALFLAIWTIYIFHPLLFVIFLSWATFFCGISIIFAKKILNYSGIASAKRVSLTGKLVDSISNISAIRAFVTHKLERNYIRAYVDQTVISTQNTQKFVLKIHYLLGLSCDIMIFFIIYFLAKIYSNGKITIGDFAMILSLCSSVTGDMFDLCLELSEIYQEFGAFSQGLKLLSPNNTVTDDKNATNLVVKEGKIEFVNVNFKYDQDNKIFSNKSITIPGKFKVGLVGFSGSGKSTFINLICRLYDVDKGSIYIDKQNIKHVTQASLHNNLSIIPQDPVLFHRSIKENIQYGSSNATEGQIYEAAKKANIHNFIMSLPDHYNTNCGERGNILSVGQRQQIVIARAILKHAPILILDEATSALDSVTEELINKSLVHLMQDTTALVIAHRLSTLTYMDKILVFDKGMIVEDGTHEQLLKQGNLYHRLWNSQAQQFI